MSQDTTIPAQKASDVSAGERYLTSRGAWILPAACVFAFMLWRSIEPYVISLDRSRIRVPCAMSDLAAAMVVTLCAIAFVIAWRAGIRWSERESRATRVVPVTLLLVAIGVAACEATMRSAPVQTRLWSAVQSRLGSSDWFVGNVARVRLDMLAASEDGQGDEVVVIGSSQAAAGINPVDLEKQIAPRRVSMRGLADMDSRRILFALPYLDVDAGDTALLYLSSRDVAASQPFTMNWMRPFASPEGARELLGVLGLRVSLANWKHVIDLALAANLETWRSRDYVRHVTDRLLAMRSGTSSSQQMLQRDLDADLSITAEEEERLMTLQFAALRRALTLLCERAAHVVVVEGRLNPGHLDDKERAVQARLSARLLDDASKLPFHFAAVSQQPFENPPEDWTDATHLNATGSAKLTSFVAAYLHDQVWHDQ